MITNLDPTSELFLANVERIQERIASASRQVSSGRKVATASDAPDQIDTILQLRADQQRNAQIKSNLTLARTHAEAADGALTTAIKLMDRARVLAAQGATATTTDSGRKAMADEVGALFDEALGASRTAIQGRYIFSGDDASNPPYQADATSATGVSRVATSEATTRIESPAGGSFPAGLTARDIFDNRNADDTLAADNVFAALHNLQAALLGGNTDAITQASANVDAASLRLNAKQSFYGAVEGRIDDALSFAEQYETQIQAQLSDKQDADVISAALTLTQNNTQLQAALQMRAAMPHKSLFDFLG